MQPRPRKLDAETLRLARMQIIEENEKWELPCEVWSANDGIYDQLKLPKFVKHFIDHPIFAKMQKVKQLGLCYLVYPSAHHTRFQHSLGVCHL